MSRLTIEPKRLREPQEGGQSREENRDIRKNVDIKISRCGAGGSAPALGAGCRRFESCHLDHNPFKPHCYAVYFFTDRFLTVLFQKFC